MSKKKIIILIVIVLIFVGLVWFFWPRIIYSWWWEGRGFDGQGWAEKCNCFGMVLRDKEKCYGIPTGCIVINEGAREARKILSNCYNNSDCSSNKKCIQTRILYECEHCDGGIGINKCK
ncbi:MAG TPA: hypothetical protein PLH37_00535 [bacterium]|nr:hypothetical protein [bacterium]